MAPKLTNARPVSYKSLTPPSGHYVLITMTTSFWMACCNKSMNLVLLVGMFPIPYAEMITAFELLRILSITLWFMHGAIFIVEISSHRSVKTLISWKSPWLWMLFQCILKLVPTSPRRPEFGELKAMMLLVLTFLDLFPLIRRLPKNIMTSGMTYYPPIKSDPRKLSIASFFNSSIGIWLPVKITGLLRFSNINDSAEAQYAIVSVPWRITKASNFW